MPKRLPGVTLIGEAGWYKVQQPKRAAFVLSFDWPPVHTGRKSLSAVGSYLNSAHAGCGACCICNVSHVVLCCAPVLRWWGLFDPSESGIKSALKVVYTPRMNAETITVFASNITCVFQVTARPPLMTQDNTPPGPVFKARLYWQRLSCRALLCVR